MKENSSLAKDARTTGVMAAEKAAIKTANLEAVVASVPLNSTAARVMAKGVHYEPDLKVADTHRRSAVPLPTIPVPRHVLTCSTYPNFIGKTFGHFNVIGYSAEQPINSNANWIVRCSCGRYESRKAKSIRRAAETGMKCAECEHLEIVRKRYRREGSRPLSDFGVGQSAASTKAGSEPHGEPPRIEQPK